MLLYALSDITYEVWLEFTHEKPGSGGGIIDSMASEHIALSDNLRIEENTWNKNDDILPILIEKPEVYRKPSGFKENIFYVALHFYI